MTRLLIANAEHLFVRGGRDVDLWAEIYKIIPLSVSLVDRSSNLRFPFRFHLHDDMRLPTELDGFNMSYEDCCNQRAQELAAIQEKLQVPMAVMYSGGIDSTLAIVSLAKILGSELKDRVRVFLSPDSIKENPGFYFDFIRKHCSFDSSEKLPLLFDKRHIVIGGEHNDQLFGSDIIAKLEIMGPFSEALKPYTRDYISGFFEKKGMSKAAANAWFDVLESSIAQAPCEIESAFDYFWWFNFLFKWQTVYFRMFVRLEEEQRKHVSQEFIDTYYHHFYNAPYFQKWSMLNKSLKVQDTWSSYKFHAKALIRDFTGDDYYYRHKVKIGSLCRLFLQKHLPAGFTSDYKAVFQIDPDEHYQPENAFSALS